MHPPSAGLSNAGVSQSRANQEATEVNVSHDMGGMASDEATVTAVTGAGERVCLSVVPVKVLVKDSSLMPVQTYALLDSGSEVTLCHEKLRERLGASGTKLQFTLSGMTGSSRVESQQIDLVVMSMDESVSVELSNVRTVNYMPISESCIAKKEDLENWPHLSDIELQQLDIGGVILVIGLKEKANLFLPLECRAGEEGEPVAVRYSLGWTVIGRVGGESYSGECSANFLRLVDSSNVCTNMLHLEDSVSYDNLKTGVAFPENEENAGERIVTDRSCMEPKSDTKRMEQPLLQDEIALRAQNEELNQQLERLWKTDFENSEVETRVSASVVDKRALEVMERTLKMVDGHYQVALPWRYDTPYLPNNRVVAERRGLLLKKRLLRDEAMREKYKATMTDYIEKGSC